MRPGIEARSSGTTYQYTAPNGMDVTVDVYDNGRRVPNGSGHPTIINQFTEELENIRQQAQSVGMANFEKPAVPSACSYGPWNLRCITFSAAGGSATGRIFGNIRAGQMTPLVMMNNIRSPNFPNVPLLSEVGYDGPPSRSYTPTIAW